MRPRTTTTLSTYKTVLSVWQSGFCTETIWRFKKLLYLLQNFNTIIKKKQHLPSFLGSGRSPHFATEQHTFSKELMFVKKLCLESCHEEFFKSASTFLQRKWKNGRAGPDPQQLLLAPSRDAAFSESEKTGHWRNTECSPGFGPGGWTTVRLLPLDSEKFKY